MTSCCTEIFLERMLCGEPRSWGAICNLAAGVALLGHDMIRANGKEMGIVRFGWRRDYGTSSA